MGPGDADAPARKTVLTLYWKVVYSSFQMPRYLLLATIGFTAGLCSCSQSNNLLLGEVQAQVGAHTVRVTDCYRTSVPAPERLADANGQASYRFMPCRDADVRIRGGELTVNGRIYGHIQDNDSILVDHGVVSVTPSPLQANHR
jgi:hypothetical protein